MYSSDARMVRGVSIAVIIFSSLALAGGIILMFALAVGGAVLGDPSFISHMSTAYSDPEVVSELGRYANAEDIAIVGTLSVGIAMAVTVGFMLCAVVSLIGGIMGLRRAAQPDKIGSAFGWAIAGAIAAFISARVITAILLVIAAIYLNKIKNAPAIPVQPYGQPYMPQQAYPAQQPYVGQPYEQQPYAPQQPPTPPQQQ